MHWGLSHLSSFLYAPPPTFLSIMAIRQNSHPPPLLSPRSISVVAIATKWMVWFRDSALKTSLILQ
jgi:hypothetical protein